MTSGAMTSVAVGVFRLPLVGGSGWAARLPTWTCSLLGESARAYTPVLVALSTLQVLLLITRATLRIILLASVHCVWLGAQCAWRVHCWHLYAVCGWVLSMPDQCTAGICVRCMWLGAHNAWLIICCPPFKSQVQVFLLLDKCGLAHSTTRDTWG